MERLKVLLGFVCQSIFVHLHSSMERLKAAAPPTAPIAAVAFTFQYGEIKRPAHPAGRQALLQFTFQYGEIKRSLWVRQAKPKPKFTFQYGEIKRQNKDYGK